MVRAQLYGEEWLVGGPRQSFWQIEHVSYASFVFGGGGASLVCAVLRLFSSSILAQSALLAACCLWNVCMLAHSLLSACLLLYIDEWRVSCLVLKWSDTVVWS